MKLESKITLFENSTDYLSYPAGTVIFNKGEQAQTTYIVKNGEVEIKVGDRVIETHGPGSLIGEMALIDNSPRSASAFAKTDCQLVAIDERRFLFLVQQTPFFALQVMHIMAERLRNFINLSPENSSRN